VSFCIERRGCVGGAAGSPPSEPRPGGAPPAAEMGLRARSISTQIERGQAFDCDSSQRARLVNPTMIASIQYWERTASLALS
jgi:hypothetical protein